MHRSAGVLLHPTSLPGPYGIGDLGPRARDYVQWLAGAGITWWQVLPLHPPGPGNSPYSAVSTFAGNPMLISPEDLLGDGLVLESEIASPEVPHPLEADFPGARAFKEAMLRSAWRRQQEGGLLQAEFDDFRARHGWWLDDFTMFQAIRKSMELRLWTTWPEDVRHRTGEALDRVRAEHADEITYLAFCQFCFFRQWGRVREAADAHGVRVLGDLPIFVALDSAEVWARPDLFKLDDDLQPTVVAGVPPDYFSATGQLWGNPVYDWERMAESGYAWWVDRVRHAVTLADAVRLDHFRGFAASWEVPAGETVASNGRWVPGPGRALFDRLRDELGGLPLVAEDLGEITEDVIQLRRDLGLPGMAILQFGFSPEPRSTFIPYRHDRDLVVYTGTHDNTTTLGWYEEEAADGERELFEAYTGGEQPPHWAMVRLALGSVADVAVVPHQDLIGAPGARRMNRPGVGEGNWGFRITEEELGADVQARLGALVATYGR